jgi:hypothetical protein
MQDPIDSEAHVETFDLAPISLWLEDFSKVRKLFDTWRQSGITDIKAYLSENENRIKQCSSLIRVIKVNKRTLSLFEATDVDHLTQNLGSFFAGICSSRTSRNSRRFGMAIPNSQAIP